MGFGVNMKKVGILTHWDSLHNYGQKLQAYSLEKYIETQNIKPTLIKYRRDGLFWHITLFKRYISEILRILLSKTTNTKCYASRKLDFFSCKYLKISLIKPNFASLIKKCNEYSLLITGSDQVWSSLMYYNNKKKTFEEKVLAAFTLAIPCDAKKIAYAASAGHFFPPEFCENTFLTNLRNLDLISVREQNLANYLTNHGIDCVVVPDPVFLLSKSDYIKLSGTTFYDCKFKKKCFYYSLMHPSSMTITETESYLLAKFEKEYIHVSGDEKRKGPFTDFPTIEEWLAYIGNADLVITNSFHCVAFSVIFHSDFYYIPLLPENGIEDERITTLLNYLEIENREIKSINELENKLNYRTAIDWDNVDVKLSEYSDIGKTFLKKAFSLIK